MPSSGKSQQRSKVEQGLLIMTLLTHPGGPFEPAFCSSAKRKLTGVASPHRATIKRICLLAGVFLLALSTVGGVIALRTAIFLSRLSH